MGVDVRFRCDALGCDFYVFTKFDGNKVNPAFVNFRRGSVEALLCNECYSRIQKEMEDELTRRMKHK